MRRAEGSAAAKAILVGEHSVVYGEPAIAIPLPALRAYAELIPSAAEQGFRIEAPDVNRAFLLDEAAEDDPLAMAVRLALDACGIESAPPARLILRSAIPIAAGMGSGAAVTVAILRAVSQALGAPLPQQRLNALAYEVEKLYHGTPSGIDNTVIVWEQPIWFVRGQATQKITLPRPLPLLLADAGPAPPTRRMVEAVRQHHEADPRRYGAHFARMGAIAHEARAALESGHLVALGWLLRENHRLLRAIGVSTPKLDRLVEAAQAAGAYGAKLTGAGGGGRMLALIPPERRAAVREALLKAGATQVMEA